MKYIFLLTLAFVFSFCGTSRHTSKTTVENGKAIKTGAEQTEKYLPYLQGKRVAMMANLTSVIGKTHLVDSLKSRGVNIVKVFGPEHGFRGNASAGVHVADEVDIATDIPVISLYGKKTNPPKKTLPMLIFLSMTCRMWAVAFIPISMHWCG